jgi:uncharacterized protein YutE (UPF0331/DUF86 family)
VTSKEIKVVNARINEELKNISTLTDELKQKKLYQLIDGFVDDSFFLRSIGSVLHDFYVAVENTLKIICSEVDEKLPEGSNWHILLLKQASYEIPDVRPAVISKRTMDNLDKYRAFRHIFRNVYGYNLDSKRIKELLLELPETVELFTEDVLTFMNLLDQL